MFVYFVVIVVLFFDERKSVNLQFDFLITDDKEWWKQLLLCSIALPNIRNGNFKPVQLLAHVFHAMHAHAYPIGLVNPKNIYNLHKIQYFTTTFLLNGTLFATLYQCINSGNKFEKQLFLI